MTPAFVVERATRASRIGLPLSGAMLALLLSLPFWAGRAELRLIVEMACYLALAQMWSLLAGLAGLVSIGQQAWVGIGGYALFLLTIYLGIPPLPAVPLAGAITALIALPTAFVVFRLQGAYFAIGTWVVAEVYRLGFAQVSALGGGSGMSLPADILRSIAEGRGTREMLIYYLGLALAVGSIVLVYALLRRRVGMALTAIRDSETAAASLGVDTHRTKLLVYVVAALVTGMAGALIFLQKLRISPDAAFNVTDWTAYVIFIVVIGGIGTIEGPILGTLLYFALRQVFAEYGTWYLVALGLFGIGVMLKAPQGLWGLLARRHDLQLFPVGRRVRFLEETTE